MFKCLVSFFSSFIEKKLHLQKLYLDRDKSIINNNLQLDSIIKKYSSLNNIRLNSIKLRLKLIPILFLFFNFSFFSESIKKKDCLALTNSLDLEIKKYQQQIVLLKKQLFDKNISLHYDRNIQKLEKNFIPNLSIFGLVLFSGPNRDILEPGVALGLTWNFN